MSLGSAVKQALGFEQPKNEHAEYYNNVPPAFNPNYTSVYGGWEQEDLTGIVGVTLDNSSLLIHIESQLRGMQVVEFKDENGRKKTKWERVTEPVMNDRGVQGVMLELRSFLDKNSIMTYLPDEEQLNALMIDFGENFFLLIGQNFEEFEVRQSVIGPVSAQIINKVYLTLLRGLKGNEKQGVYRSTQTKRLEQYNVPVNDPRQMPGMFKR